MKNYRGLMGLGKLQALKGNFNAGPPTGANMAPNMSAVAPMPAQTMRQPETVWSRLAHLLLDKYLAEEE